ADSIPTSLGQEDHVSMGSISGRKTLQVCQNLRKILAIELLCAAQAFDFRRPLKSSSIIEAIHERVRQDVMHVESDRLFAKDIKAAIAILDSGDLIRICNSFEKMQSLIHFDLFENM
ncbi:MAG: aromatic amino acid lyase, partial [Bacteroidota bacterium]